MQPAACRRSVFTSLQEDGRHGRGYSEENFHSVALQIARLV